MKDLKHLNRIIQIFFLIRLQKANENLKRWHIFEIWNASWLIFLNLRRRELDFSNPTHIYSASSLVQQPLKRLFLFTNI